MAESGMSYRLESPDVLAEIHKAAALYAKMYPNKQLLVCVHPVNADPELPKTINLPEGLVVRVFETRGVRPNQISLVAAATDERQLPP